MRIEGGELSAQLIATIDASPAKVDQKLFRKVVSSVVIIREHQLDPPDRSGRDRAAPVLAFERRR
jgi:hypothetical protein